MGEGRSCRERELECLLEEEATKNHKVVSVAVLLYFVSFSYYCRGACLSPYRLHDGSGLKARCIHEVEIVRLAQVVVGIYRVQLEQYPTQPKSRTVILELLLPERVDQIALCVIRRVLDEGRVPPLLADLRVSLAQSVQSLFFFSLYDQRVNIDWSER